MIEKYLPVMGVIIGVILGFILNEISKWIRDRRTIKRQKLSIRTLLNLEIEQNLSVLNNFWSKIIDIGNIQQDSDEARDMKALKLIASPIPIWSRKVWEGQISISYLVSSLSVQEIKEIHKLYCNLDTIIAIQSRLEIFRNERDIKIAQPPTSTASKFPQQQVLQQNVNHYYLRQQFQHKSRELVKECEQIVQEINNRGNPLKNGSAYEKKK